MNHSHPLIPAKAHLREASMNLPSPLEGEGRFMEASRR